jgi:Ca2+-binding RTX toxin-like protein
LLYEFGGGGWISYAFGVHGGFTIANGVTIENATGGSGNDVLIGNSASNILNGHLGADAMSGGAGDDMYFVDNSSDVVTELASGGRDLVYTSVSYALAFGSEVDILSATVLGATSAINLTGNEFSNELWGNAGANLLNGHTGTDLMIGAGGDDTYFVDNAGDAVLELAGGGFDLVYTSASYRLAAGSEVEVLSTTSQAATAAIDIFGNEFGSTIWGNAGANVLDGGGGADLLFGLGGADRYQFSSALSPANIDRIMGFESGVDKIALDRNVFAGLAIGAVGPGVFVTGTQAQDADDRIIYNQASGGLFYDADGAGGAAAVQFATLDPAAILGASDFIVI